MDVTIRRLENNLITLGTGVIAFGFWSFIKFVLTAILMGGQGWEDVDNNIKTSAVISSWIVFSLSALIYLWVGLSARAEGNGKHKSILYLIVIGMIATVSTLIFAAEILAILFVDVSISSTVITLIIDTTRIVFLIELLYSSIKLRILRKNKQEALNKEGDAA